MTDIVARLRACQGVLTHDPECNCAEAADEIERLRAAYDSRGGEMDSMRMVLAETQKWNEDRLAEIVRLTVALQRIDGINDNPAVYNSMIEEVLRAALEPMP